MEAIDILLNFLNVEVRLSLKDGRALRGRFISPITKDTLIKGWVFISEEKKFQIPIEEVESIMK